MSPLTKAFVVLTTLLSILLAALVIPFVARTGSLNEDISQMRSQLSVAEASATAARNEQARLVAQQSAGNAEMQAAVNTLTEENARLQQELATVGAARQQAQNEVAKASATKSIMAQSGERLTELVQDRTRALAEAQNELVTTKTQNAQLVQQNNELDAQVQTLTQSVRLLRERVAGAGSEATGGATYNGLSTATAGSGETVRGVVNAVESSEGITLVQVNVGANDGLRPESRLLIYRGRDRYIGTATVSTVDGNVAVARVTQSAGSIQTGDSVLAGLSF